jgi:acyl-coenzyme A thioesterase PaaI-like protein
LIPPAAERLERARALADRPMARWLGLSAVVEDGALVYRLSFAERHIGNPLIRAIHGGVVAAFLQLAAEIDLAAGLGLPAPPRTATFSIDFMSPTRAEDMSAAVSLARVARRVAFLEATGWQGDRARPVAAARACVRLAGAPGRL